VNDLIDPVQGVWDEDLVVDTFGEDDAAVILSLPIHIDMDDVPAWHFDHKGVFSVKSAYWLQCERGQGEMSKGQPHLVQGLSWEECGTRSGTGSVLIE